MEEFRKEEQQEQEEHRILNAVLNFLNDNGEEICKIIVAIILGIAMITTLKFIAGKRTTIETKEEYTTATIVGFDEKTIKDMEYIYNGISRSRYLKYYYIELYYKFIII